jgi:hypothetical protein
MAGEMSWIRGRSAGATMTGASDSSKLVSGESARGTTEAKIAAPSRNRTNVARNRITVATTSFFKLLRRLGLVNGRFRQLDGKLLMYCAALLRVVRLLRFFRWWLTRWAG